MPQWLCNQLRKAFHKKDRKHIRLLNDCWFFYRNHISKIAQPSHRNLDHNHEK